MIVAAKKVWGKVKESRPFQILLSFMGGLPVVDIVTDYAFIIVSLAYADKKSSTYELQKILSIVTVITLYYSSRLVLFCTIKFHNCEDGDYLTAKNMFYYFVPGTIEHWFVNDPDIDWKRSPVAEKSQLILLLVIIHLFLPLLHFVYVVYCCFKQFQAHYNDSEDFPQFVPMAVIEVYESAPQFLMQTILFWLEHKTLNTKWEAPHVLYLLSSTASLFGIIKAIYVYNLRYEVVIRGFEGDREHIDDAALAFELLKEGNYRRFEKVLTRMMHHGKDINQPFCDGETALSYAGFNGHTDAIIIIVHKLVSFGANLEVEVRPGETLFIWAARTGHTDVMDKLVSADANLKTKNRWTALIEAAYYGQTDAINKLVSAGANLDAKSNGGDTALTWAARRGHTDVIDKLVSAGANLEAQTENGSTALILAARGGHTDVIDKLVSAGANLEAQTENGSTALMLAALRGHADVIDKLVSAGANLETQNRNGYTASSLAKLSGHTDCAMSIWAVCEGHTDVSNLVDDFFF